MYVLYVWSMISINVMREYEYYGPTDETTGKSAERPSEIGKTDRIQSSTDTALVDNHTQLS